MNTLSKGHIIITIDPELFCFPRNVDEYKNERTEKEISLKMIKTDSFICRKKWLTDFFFCNFSNINSPVRQKRHDKNCAQWLGYIFGNIILDSKFNVYMYIRPFFTKKTIYNKVEHVKSAYIDITLLCSIYEKLSFGFWVTKIKTDTAGVCSPNSLCNPPSPHPNHNKQGGNRR